MKPFRLIVIGGGSAGHAAARTAARLGLETLLVEAAPTLGGLCILRGCMPSKLLIATADRMRECRSADHFAVRNSSPRLDEAQLRRRLHQVISGFQDARRQEMAAAPYRLIRDRAQFIDPHTLRLENSGDTLRADAFIVATGSTPSIPPIPGLSDTPFWTSDEVTQFPSLPSSVTIIGSGAVGMEFAHLYEGLGSQVTVLSRSSRILSKLHPDLGQTVAAASEQRGIDIRFQTEAQSVRHDGSRFHLHLSDESHLCCQALILATGRSPSTSSLHLDQAGLTTDDTGRLPINELTQTSQPHIFAAGDCASPLPVVHLAVVQGEVAAHQAAHLRTDHQVTDRSWEPHLKMQGIFTHPEVVSLGVDPHDDELESQGLQQHRYSFSDLGKGEILNAQGHIRLVSEKSTGRLVGAHAVGPGVVDSSHVMLLAIKNRMTLDDLRRTPFYHPSLAEIWSYALDSD
ncbi:pyruvate/2-oxoglutarate dehydrogenase complex dihydrolipoamide dehydrogenase (E3) component [Haloferula luteola]|uniref:Pyruvate/2-oxoglutarate dehydrogenase complex dihydrolipoamide dehydrogenase (E3) component n=1 Tax=Haloferula luteola TaxID=595692 RepID=A0A840UVZ5_9BACT|nr:NAD(P)/FAD-dependent oxidoreductase [Haloferula luteola]MBB5350347.1 pyruvate/2-oxoglutarate dehydrogenase complex dihydrolipoamide dehydrogenase (E3) component [Haloferula luteola]